MTNDPLRPLVDLLKALAHPVRLRILALLRGGELCVCQVRAVIGLPNSTISEHLGELRRAGLLTERKEGKWVYYTLQTTAQLEALWPDITGTAQVARDLAAAVQIRNTPVEITCRDSKSCTSPARSASSASHKQAMGVQP